VLIASTLKFASYNLVHTLLKLVIIGWITKVPLTDRRIVVPMRRVLVTIGIVLWHSELVSPQCARVQRLIALIANVYDADASGKLDHGGIVFVC
jgi:hypothetical protein